MQEVTLVTEMEKCEGVSERVKLFCLPTLFSLLIKSRDVLLRVRMAEGGLGVLESGQC